MKYTFLLLFTLTITTVSAQETAITGVNKGQSLYIQNPYNKDSSEFCINEVTVNDKRINLNLRLSALKINFDKKNLFTPVTIVVKHKEYCKPRIVNPEVILYHSSFKFDSLFLNDSLLTWHTKGDRRGGVYKVERLEEDYWEVLKRQRAKGYFEGAEYVFFTDNKADGNIYRIKYELPSGRFLYSQEMEFFYYPTDITFSPSEVTNEIILSIKAPYVITNEYGKELMRGNAKIIPVGMLKAGEYFIEIDGNNETFTKL